jgi:hypothetical protein
MVPLAPQIDLDLQFSLKRCELNEQWSSIVKTKKILSEHQQVTSDGSTQFDYI